ncbi:MAG: hypothetical protein HYV09_00105 [Deltaproteobacteria bacterium]|nr:hypothetical protein [Deltaproteobacteria bacterium]
MHRSLRGVSVFVVASFALACSTERDVDPSSAVINTGADGAADGTLDDATVVEDTGPGIVIDSSDETSGTCKPTTCAAAGANCGKIADGCGALIDCGPTTCPNPSDVCGAVKPNVCGSSCKPQTCADVGATCGKQGDGCGAIIDCGTCTAPDTCGGGGVPNKCGFSEVDTGVVCTPKTCATAGFNCGKAGDGCGGVIDCGTCTAPEVCGGGGVANKCGGAPVCTPKKCSDYGYSCGLAGDGCGGTIDCGTCTAPQTCGGGGIPSVCGGGAATCVNLECKKVKCDAGTSSISGVVYDPAGKTPLYNVFVFIPNGTPGSFADGATCDKCADALSGYPLVTAITNEKGEFKLNDVPVGAGIPLVIQTGKWRRQVPITTAACTNTVIPKDLTRLPRDKSEGHLPKIALTTGGFDALECLLRKIGISDSEFTNPSGLGRVNLYKGMPPKTYTLSGGSYIPGATGAYTSGALFPDATTLWNDATQLKKYDIVLMACEGAEYGDPSSSTSVPTKPTATVLKGTKSATSLANMKSFVDTGGRVFASHYHRYWLKSGPTPFPSLASWNDYQDFWPTITERITTTFPKGAAMANWLVNIGASSTVGTLAVSQAQHSISSVDATKVLDWIYAKDQKDLSGANVSYATQYFSFNTPVGVTADSQCGRFVYSDIHVSSGDKTDAPFPSGCTTTTMSPQELALEFMFFDLASRVCDETKPPPPPTCKALTCAEQGIECGPAADGCGGLLACGTCVSPKTCGGGGVPGKCGSATCTPKTCTAMGVECGPTGDGCGNIISCGTCTPPASCGGGGVPGKCGYSETGTCTKIDCGGRCGPQGDGCGGLPSCPPCDGGTCAPTDCTKAGAECGVIGDGCGGTIDCGTCTPPKTCGGSGVPYKCGGIG